LRQYVEALATMTGAWASDGSTLAASMNAPR
jgi:hypothetical protein